MPTVTEKTQALVPCRECSDEVSREAYFCPHCGAPSPASEKWNGWGIEYTSRTTLWGLPLVHVCFKYRMPFFIVPARGIVAVGHVSVGVVGVGQFALGGLALGQFAAGGWVLAQIGLAWDLIAQLGVYVHWGYGQVLWKLAEMAGG